MGDGLVVCEDCIDSLQRGALKPQLQELGVSSAQLQDIVDSTAQL